MALNRLQSKISRLLTRDKHAPNVELWFRNHSNFSIKLGRGYQSRNEAVAALLLEALREVKYDLKRPFVMRIFTADQPPHTAEKVAAFCTDTTRGNIVLIPDFIFWNWPEIGIESYPATVTAMLEASKHPPVHDNLFWIGNPETHPNRQKLIELSQQDHRIRAVSVGWNAGRRPENWARNEAMATKANNYVSLAAHCQYRYLIDVEGVGYSGRVKILLFSGRPLFLQARRWKEYFFDELKPFYHYIPVIEDLSDLSDRITWAENNPEASTKIAANAQSYARSNLTRRAAVLHLARTLQSFSKCP